MSLRRVLSFLTASVVGGLFLLAPSSAGAVDNPDYTAPPPTTVVTTPAPASKVTTAVAASPERTSLAITGSDAVTTAVIGVSLLAGGAVVLAVRRRVAA